MAYYSEDLIEEVVSQNDIIDVISEYVTLKKSGRNFMGLCPFHREKTPSFCASIDKQIFKCFGCSEGGNVISFIMKIENLDFWDSIEILAQRANIDLRKYEVNKYNSARESDEKRNLKERLFNINKDIAKYYHNNLITLLAEPANRVKDYVIKRNLDLKTIKKFGLGFANGKVSLYEHLTSLGYTKDEIFATGILIQNERGKIYDRFFSRIIFPIFDIRDRVIAFGGRVLDNSLPKYVNSPENDIYHKGKNLYSLNLAKREKLENIIIVEGYMDTIALQKSGFNNTVASLGTALTDSQARLIKKYTDTVIIAYDQDGAGQEATLRGLDILSSKNLKVKVLKLDKTDVKDPDEYINKYGAERFKKCIKNSISLVEFKIEKLEKSLDLEDMDSKIFFLTKVASIISKIDNSIEREIYISRIARKYNISSGPIFKEVEKRIKKSSSDEIVIDMQSLNRKMQFVSNVKKRQEQYIIALMLSKDKNILNKILDTFTEADFEDENVRFAFKFIIELNSEFDIAKIDIISKIKNDVLLKEITDILYIDISNLDKIKLLNDVLKTKKKEKLISRRDEIIKRFDENISKDEQEIIQLELNQIIVELSKLK